MVAVALLTGGDPSQLSGGHLFHRRMAEAAGAHGAELDTILALPLRNPLRDVADGAVALVDSLVAARVAPWAAMRARDVPLAAIVHQRPGGVDHGALRTRSQRRMDVALYRRCALLLAVSDSIADELAERTGVPREQLVVVQPGRDLPVAAGRVEMRHRRRVAVLCVANWFPNKGIVELLDAVARTPADDVTLHLVGATDVDPRYAVRVHARLSSPELAGRVVVHGVMEPRDLAVLYAGADVFALTSRTEAFGTVYAEALTAGLPIVGWRSGNLAHLVTDGLEGCLLDVGDVAGLAQALTRLARDDIWRLERAAAARRRAATLPTWNDTAKTFFDALSQLDRSRG